MLRRRVITLAMLLATAVSPALAPTRAEAATACGPGVRGDVDGNGVADLVVSAAIVAGQPSVLHDFDIVRYPSMERVHVAASTIDATASSDVRLKRAAVADLDGDGCSEVVFAGDIPDPAVSPIGAAYTGARLYVVPGSPAGPDLGATRRINLTGGVQQLAALPGNPSRLALTTTSAHARQALLIHTLAGGLKPGTTRTVTGSSLGVKDTDYGFGHSLAGWGRTLVVGSPSEAVGSRTAGAVHLFTFSATDPAAVQHLRITQNSTGISGTAEWGDRFGWSVDYRDGRLAIGVPDEQVGDRNNAGMVHLVRWNEATRKFAQVRSFHQGSSGVPGANENWDRFGYAVRITRGLSRTGSYDAVVDANLEAIGAVRAAGALTITDFDRATYRSVTQNTAGVPGTVGESHVFGWVLGVRQVGPAMDSLLASANDGGAGCGTGMVMQTSPGPLTSTSWSLVPERGVREPCWVGAWGYEFGR